MTRITHEPKMGRSISYLLGLSIIITSFSATITRSQPASPAGIQKIRDVEQLIQESERVLSDYPDSDFSANLMFQLIQLYVKRSDLGYEREMLIYEEEEARGGLQNRLPPTKEYGEAIRLSERLLEKFPDVNFRDKVLYRVALCYMDQGMEERAVEQLKLLSIDTTNQAYLDEAFFRLGEYYFDQKTLDTAIDFYSRIIERYDSPYFEMSLYKLGWSYYIVDDYVKAISTFLYLIEDINLVEEVRSYSFGKTKTDLREESIEYIANCFSEYGGPTRAKEFLFDKKDKDYTEKILSNLASIYKERNFYSDAIDVQSVLLEFYPLGPNAPFYQKEIVENLLLADDADAVDDARIEFIEKYGLHSAWLTQAADHERRGEVLAIAEEYFYVLGTEAQQVAQASGSRPDYDLAITRYRSYLKTFPQSARSDKVSFYLSECLYEIGNFRQAALAYADLIEIYPDSDLAEIASYHRILTYNQILQQDLTADSTEFFLMNFLGKGEDQVATITVLNSTQAKLLKASNEFAVRYFKSSKYAEVLMNFAQILYELESYAPARDVYQKAIVFSASTWYLPQAYMMVAQCEFQMGDFEKAQEWFRKLVEAFPDSSHYVSKANKLIASSRYRVAESYLAKGDTTQAVSEFEKIAAEVSDPAVAEKALLTAAGHYEGTGNLPESIGTYELMLLRFPNSEQLDESLFKAARLSERLPDWPRAAKNYLDLYKNVPQSEYASSSLFAAARCFENMSDPISARFYYGEYVDVFYQEPERHLEAAFKKGEIAYLHRKTEDAMEDFAYVVAAHQDYLGQNLSVQTYYPANAQFLIAEITFQKFKDIEIEPPLQQTLQRKRSEFTRVIQAYTAAAKYRVAEWTTASTYKIGAVFEDLATAIMDSPRPENLTGNPLSEYNQKLAESVLPFKQKALESYESNVRRAEVNRLDNYWISESKKSIARLRAELNSLPAQVTKQSGL